MGEQGVLKDTWTTYVSLRGGGLKQWILAEARREIKVLCVKKKGKKQTPTWP